MRSNYTQRVARLFEYPYSTGFDTSVNKLNVSEKDRFMQSLLSYQRINPFHYDCKQTRKMICTCNSQNQTRNAPKNQRQLFEFRCLADYLDKTLNGHTIQKQNKLMRKVTHMLFLILGNQYLLETERLRVIKVLPQRIERQNLTFKLLKTLELQYESLKKVCEHCNTSIYDYTWKYGWKKQDGQGSILCELCYKKMININPMKSAEFHNQLSSKLIAKNDIEYEPTIRKRTCTQSTRTNLKYQQSSSALKSYQVAKSQRMMTCVSCSKQYDRTQKRMFQDKAVCKNCYSKFQEKGNFCAKCKKLFQLTCEEDNYFVVGCDMCDNWFHCKCAGLPEKTEEEIQKQDYICPDCLSKKR